MQTLLSEQLSVFTTLQPKTLTFITTYKCTAACAECCFECHQKIEGRLDLQFMLDKIDEALASFPTLEVVIFTGGECFLLGDDLFKVIEHATKRGLKSRCVTNGYWGKTPALSKKYARNLVKAGITEINISTGADHAEWVSVDTVINCAKALADEGVNTLITVEKDKPQTSILDQIRLNPTISKYTNLENGLIKVITNVWMPFHENSEERQPQENVAGFEKGCEQLLNNIVITPHKRHSACCGLTLEHIPEMHLGNTTETSLLESYNSQFNDFLKLWIRIDGPTTIIRKLMGDDAKILLEGVVHICQACAVLHKSPAVLDKLQMEYSKHVPEIFAKAYLREQIAKNQVSTNRPTVEEK